MPYAYVLPYKGKDEKVRKVQSVLFVGLRILASYDHSISFYLQMFMHLMLTCFNLYYLSHIMTLFCFTHTVLSLSEFLFYSLSHPFS